MTSTNDTAFHQFLNAYRAVPDADFALISAAMHFRSVKAGTILLREGGIARELYFITGGILKIITTSRKGTEVIQFFVREHKCCTILYSFQEEVAAQEGIVAATDAAVLAISRQALYQLYDRLPYLRGLIEGITRQALLDKVRLRNSLMGEEATARYRLLLAQQPDILQRVSLGDVASYLGITQQSLSRIRRSLAAAPEGR